MELVADVSSRAHHGPSRTQRTQRSGFPGTAHAHAHPVGLACKPAVRSIVIAHARIYIANTKFRVYAKLAYMRNQFRVYAKLGPGPRFAYTRNSVSRIRETRFRVYAKLVFFFSVSCPLPRSTLPRCTLSTGRSHRSTMSVPHCSQYILILYYICSTQHAQSAPALHGHAAPYHHHGDGTTPPPQHPLGLA